MALKLKINEENKAPVMDEKNRFVYVEEESGKELFLDPVSMYSKIIDLGKENQGHRTKKEEIEQKLKVFSGIEDIEKWKEEADKAIDAVKNFNDKDWMKAEKVDQLKKDMSLAYEEKIKQKDLSFSEKEKSFGDTIEKLNSTIRGLLVSNKFANSKYFNGENPVTILPAQIAEDHFGKYFKVEKDNKENLVVNAYYPNGDLIWSKNNPGESADFEEAIGLIIEQYPNKNFILRSSNTGSGSTGNQNGKEEFDEIKTLEKQLEKAIEVKDVRLSIALKNKIIQAKQKQLKR